MTKEELFKLRDDYAKLATIHAKRKTKFVYLTITMYVVAITLFIIGISINKDTRPYLLIFKVLSSISGVLIGGGTITLGFWVYHGIIESQNKKKRDKVSYELTSIALKKYE